MPQRIVIIGAGFAGMWSALAARRLITLSDTDPVTKMVDIEVIVISPEERLVLRPRLYEANPEMMTAPLGELFRVTGVQFIKGAVDLISTKRREVELVNHAGVRFTQPYDKLVLAAGSRLVRPDIPGLDTFAFSVDQLDDAVQLDSHFHSLASQPGDVARNTVVVCGGGFTGIEVATDLAERVPCLLGDNNARVILVDSGSAVGCSLGPGPRPVIAKALKDSGIEVKLGTSIASIDACGVITSTGERIETRTAIWTAGMAATPLTSQIEGEKDRFGRLHVKADLRAPSACDVFVAGDAACAVTDDKGHSTMMSCQHAMYLGRTAGNNAAADLLHLPTSPYSQAAYGTCLDLGARGAVLTDGWDRKVILSGSLGKAVKQYINTILIYPPIAEREKALAAAQPKTQDPPMTLADAAHLLRLLLTRLWHRYFATGARKD
ncbi:hypothetical protein NLG97_g13 [Lecanicillium saksenae]|uniref:Uncharacterized protein n=1 Tax=Lecanicillium saksenae TaxID=468837 RepID=A0ACC1R7T3_9HYPO|nr:hypothetical protein NLG97_g13 [Lecanicillium saksenae]